MIKDVHRVDDVVIKEPIILWLGRTEGPHRDANDEHLGNRVKEDVEQVGHASVRANAQERHDGSKEKDSSDLLRLLGWGSPESPPSEVSDENYEAGQHQA